MQVTGRTKDETECAAADIGSTTSPRKNPSFLFMSPYKILSKVMLIVEHDSSDILTEIIMVNVRLIGNIIKEKDRPTETLTVLERLQLSLNIFLSIVDLPS
ncbi:hypothetical protein LSAT2_021778 [Lamellibrachia satsuma]|nr:hypothetical protein LSAT2_021778 [Lamellibrachia satsuma]